MDFLQIIMTPFSWLLIQLYNLLFHNYGLALIVFALVIKVILFPLSLKGKRGMIQMNMLSGQQEALKKRYGDNKQKLNEEIQKLYEKEGVNPMGGCLWSFLPLLILFPLYAVVRRPLRYLMNLSDTAITAVLAAVGLAEGGAFAEIQAANMFFSDPSALAAAKTAADGAGNIFAMNFSMFGIDLSAVPQWNFFLDGNNWTWANIGLFLIPVVSALTGLVSSLIMQRTSRMNATSGAPATNNTMMLLMGPVMSLWIGFTMPAGMGIYWIANNLFTIVQEFVAGKMLKEDYAKAAAAKAERERLAKEEEKRTKAERAARLAEEKSKPKAAKKQPKDISPDASREGIRAHARGRAYDPNRYGGVTPYREPGAADEPPQAEDTAEALPDAPEHEATVDALPAALEHEAEDTADAPPAAPENEKE